MRCEAPAQTSECGRVLISAVDEHRTYAIREREAQYQQPGAQSERTAREPRGNTTRFRADISDELAGLRPFEDPNRTGAAQ